MNYNEILKERYENVEVGDIVCYRTKISEIYGSIVTHRVIDKQKDNNGNIYECRKRGFEVLEIKFDFLCNTIVAGSYGEDWSLRKVMRRFIWHDRIHARAMYRMAVKVFGAENVANPFCF